MIAFEQNFVDKRGVPFVVRAGQEGDAVSLYQYKSVIFRETDLLLQSPEDFDSDPDREALFLRRFLISPNSVYLVAKQGDQVVGTASLYGGMYRRNRHVVQLGMGVLKEWWSLGIGSSLLEATILWARSTPVIRKIILQVYHTNDRAIRLYERHGFQREGRLVNDVKLDDGTFVDLAVMALHLD